MRSWSKKLDHHLHAGMDSHDELESVDRTNPLTSPDTFASKLKHRAVNRTRTPLTALIATCPLILGLLNAERDYAEGIAKLKRSELDIVYHRGRKTIMASHEEELRQQAYSDIRGMFCDETTWALLDHVYISGWSLKA